jgi:hypothetical protein
MLSQSSPVPLGRPRKPHGKRPLAIVLREHGVFSTAHAVDLALDVCDALATVHANDVVHGQLGLRCVRLAISRERGPHDLDIFTLADPDDGELATQALPFLAPEQRDLSRPIDGRADLWAIGALLYVTIVGRPLPPQGATEVPEGTMPASLAAIVLSCLAAQPERRPQDVDELTEKLGSFATWPPDRFARLAERREQRASAERARLALAARGLQNMPDVLDRLDDAAVARAQREATPKTATMASILERPTSTAALERLMAVVHEGTEAARVELAADLPALVDFDDEDEEVLPTTVATEPLVLEAFASPLDTVPLVLAQPAPTLWPPPPPPPAAPRPARPLGPILGLAAGAFVVSLALGYLGFRLSAAHTAAPAPAVVVAPPAEVPAAPPPVVSAAPAPAEIPLFVPSALPEVAPVSPGSLPDAKR